MNLLPRPRSLTYGEGRVPSRPPAVRADASLPPEGYELTIGPDRVELAAADDAGEFYGRATLAQVQKLHGDDLPACTIRDWPDLPVRGVMLDVSRDKVPTMATVRDLIARLASWKVNHVELYMEHTFAYKGHEEVWEHASPFTADEIQELDELCRAQHVELVANQNCLGHYERWLKHDRYRPLAIAPDGWTERGRHREPTTIDPAKPGSLALVRDLLSQLLPNFTSRRVHVGLDEPWELPDERVGEYGDWVRTLRSLPELDGMEMLVWGDILAGHPELLARVPKGVTVCEWGYEDWHPFADRARALRDADLPFWVCPGTSSWLTILGRVTNMRGNCAGAMAAALDHGGSGFLTTDWGDRGHLQYLPISEPGFAYAAAVSWCLEANRDLDLAPALDVHAFDDETASLGAALLALGDAHRVIGPQFFNISTLVMHLYFPQLQLGRSFTEGLNVEELAKAEGVIADAVAAVRRAQPRRADGQLVVDELTNAAAIVTVLCRDARARLESDGWLASIPSATRSELAAALAPLIDEHRRLWLARNRPGGLDDSARWLEHLLDCYRTGTVDKSWGGW